MSGGTLPWQREHAFEEARHEIMGGPGHLRLSPNGEPLPPHVRREW